jgi:arylsulfatase A-like enzyme
VFDSALVRSLIKSHAPVIILIVPDKLEVVKSMTLPGSNYMQSSSRWLLGILLIALGTLIGGRTFAAETSPRPNIVFIYADDWRWDCLGVVQREQGERARFPWLETPRLDKLAQESVRFRQSFVVNSLCSPGRACVLTSRYSHLNGIIGNQQPFSIEAPNFAKQLRMGGYATAYCGKYHMDSQRERPGFEYVASFVGQGKYVDCPIILNGKQTPTKGWIDDVTTDYAIKFLDAQSKEQPFFLWLGFKSPHGPRGGENLPERARGLYADDEPRDGPNLDVPAVFNSDVKTAAQPVRRNRQQDGIRDYMRHITAIDECVGRVIDALEENRQLANTVIIVASDNGYYLGEHQLGDKRSAYEESLRVPLLVRLPGNEAPRGTICDSLVLNIDYAPTILDFAGAEALPEAQGKSLRPLINGEAPADWRKSFFYEYFKEPRYESPTVLALRTTTHKLITYPGHEEWTEVFELEQDPYELKNLINNTTLLQKLHEEFDAQKNAVEFRMPGQPASNDRPAGKRGRRNRPVE